MKPIGFFVVLALALFTTCAFAGDFKVTSPEFTANGTFSERQVYNQFGCNGENMSPELSWQGEPAGTKSFAVTIFDPDAPTRSGWWHWLVVNINKDVHHLAGDSGNPANGFMPDGVVQARNDYGTSGYGGPCPPVGKKHRYFITVWAVDVDRLPITPESSGAMVGFNLSDHVLGKAEVIVTYGR